MTDECTHNHEFIVQDCLRCGAPVCCGKCCAEDARALEPTPEMLDAGGMQIAMNQGGRMSIAALYVETDGGYFGVPGVDPWDEARDARQYAGPHPIVAHPPCQRWGRMWHGSTRKPHQFKLGDDGGCFEAAWSAIRTHGGVIEHPCDSHAWAHFGINRPPRAGGWVADGHGGWTCCVYQGNYGHFAGKATWLVVHGAALDALPQLRWGKTEQRIHPVALAKHGYEKARRIGMMAMVGGKDKTRIRNATPPEFRDVLISIAAATKSQSSPSSTETKET